MRKRFDPSTLVRGKYSWEGTIYFAKFRKRVRLHVDLDGEQVQEYQLSYINDFLNWGPRIWEKLETPIFKYYRATVRGCDVECPVIKSKKGVWKHVRPGSVIVPAYANGANTYLRFELGCDWEPEHGMEWVIHNGSDILYVGQFADEAIKHLETQKRKNSWNYAG